LVADLRREVGEKLDKPSSLVTIFLDERILEDADVVPEGTISVVLSALPWLDDGTERIKDAGGGVFLVAGDEKKGDAKFNALCEVGFIGGEQYFEVEILEGGRGAWVGVTTKAGFDAGYKLKGLMFGGPGNLSDGSRGLRFGFGEDVKAGDVVGVLLDLSDPSTVGATFFQGERCLGKAFADCPRTSGEAVYPVVSTGQVGSRFRISLRRQQRAPDPGLPLHPAVGAWELLRFTQGTDDVDIDQAMAGKGKGKGKGKGGGLVLQVRREGLGAFALSMRVCNSLRCTVAVAPGADGADGEALAPGPVKATCMMGPQPLMDLEGQISTALGAVRNWLVTGPGTNSTQLQLSGPDAQMHFVPHLSPPQEPVSDVTLP